MAKSWLVLYIVFIGLALILSSCTTSYQDRQIKDMPGNWEVFEVTTIFLNRMPYKNSITENGDLGFFDFTRSKVDYRYIRSDSLYTGVGEYSIDKKRHSAKIIFGTVEDEIILPPNSVSHDLDFSDPLGYVEMNLTYYPETKDTVEAYILRLRKVN